MDRKHTYGIVVFFGRNENGTFDKLGQTQLLSYFTALNVYANTPNPASQLVGGSTLEEANNNVDDIVNKMKDKSYVEEYVDPYL